MDIDIFEKYSSLYDSGIPDCVFFLSFWVTSITIAILLIIMKGLDVRRTIMGVLLVECIFIIYCSTVIYRETLPEPLSNFMPFWSYLTIRDGEDMYIVENILNVILFIPLGFLACGFRRMNRWWKVALLGCVISCSIEGLQLWLQRGLCELDDVFHNTLGAILGYGSYRWIASVLSRRMMKNNNKQN